MIIYNKETNCILTNKVYILVHVQEVRGRLVTRDVQDLKYSVGVGSKFEVLRHCCTARSAAGKNVK